ncbi:BatD family protein [Thalassomonas haliotis]|uniref:Protein BatD n=1 Tax=Thalassomonas haliotis TaxID=485448 RepID=A0ABY7VK62_9GAMM|nr:BatD family protein [Thalassomonas haliotis]WDE13313.1 protein BatD [Thalassomonas haliotis]
MVKAILCFIGLLLSQLVSQPALALPQVSASVDKNPVMLNESFVLSVVASEDVGSNALDTTPLQKDFIVGRTSVSSQTSMVNFKTSYSTTWTTVLFARKTGTVTIPPLTVGSAQTQAINLQVVPASSAKAGTRQQDIFITTEVSAKDVYVQQLVTMSVKLHFSTELKRGTLSEPELEGANIQQVGKDGESESIINGRRYRIIERTYAITPQQSGDFVIAAPVFSGEVMASSNRRSSFFSFAETKPVSVMGDTISLNVRPVPDTFQGQWLPSELLTLHQEWQPELSKFTVGEPITRTITLTAAGLSEEQLPELAMEMPPGLKVYPDQAELHTSLNKDRLVSQKVRNFALVASKPGKYTLPEISVPWWNTVTNRYETSTIAAQEIEVLPGAQTANNTPFTPQAGNDLPLPGQQVQTVTVKEHSWLTWLFMALWLLTSFAWFASARGKRQKQPSGAYGDQVKDIDPYLALMAACKQNNGEQVISLLPAWINSGKHNFSTGRKKVSTLDEVIKVIDRDDFTEVINELQHHYYGREQGREQGENHGKTAANLAAWQGKKLLAILANINKKQSKKAPEVAIALNP